LIVRSSRAEQAGLVLVCALFARALPWPGTGPEPCLHPVLRAPAEVVCEPAGAPHTRLPGPARRLFDLPIDPNRADALTLETLPGIGPVRARAIIEERCRRSFASLSELQRVRGLGPARVGALEPLLAIGDPLAACDAASVESPGCRSSCGNAGAGAGAGTATAPGRSVEERR
jgi:hypothetical protein